ncbi:MAG TPA: hypothetical protein VHM30_13605 [Gemmatimonadaceae bacterium]|nr:hypothetical protein [Gemmatimonadaceae bacterium]
MADYGPNDRDPRDEPRGGEKLEGQVARETAEGREHTGGAERSRQGDGANDGDTSRGDDALGEPVQSREAGFAQHARQGQAQSPKQTNHFEPPKDQEGHHGRRH